LCERAATTDATSEMTSDRRMLHLRSPRPMVRQRVRGRGAPDHRYTRKRQRRGGRYGRHWVVDSMVGRELARRLRTGRPSRPVASAVGPSWALGAVRGGGGGGLVLGAADRCA